MTKTEAMKIARQAKPNPRKWATEKDLDQACFAADVKTPEIVDGSDLWTLDALAHAIWKANSTQVSAT